MLESSTGFRSYPRCLMSFFPVFRSASGHLRIAKPRHRTGAAVLLLLFVALPVAAENRWVTDDLEITMRTGKSNRNAIVRMLKAGTELEIVEVDRQAGYTLVRTGSGAEGWVLSRYLRRNPPAKIRLPDLESRLQTYEADQDSLAVRVNELEEERRELTRQLREAENTAQRVRQELEELQRVSASAVQVSAENRELSQSLKTGEQRITNLEEENRSLASQANREWFLVGAGVLVFGVLMGLVIPRIRWRKRSSWSDL